MRKLGELGCTGPEARARLKFLLDRGLESLAEDPHVPFRDKDRQFIRDMIEAVKVNKEFEPSYGQVTWAQDLYDKFVL